MDTLKVIKLIRPLIEEKKGEQTVVLDVRKLSTVTDFHVICSASSSRHLNALINACEKALLESGVKAYRRSGTPESGWMILDCLDFVVHAFTAKAREHYSLETLWKDAPRIP